MNTQFLITSCLRVYMQVVPPVFGRFFLWQAGVLAALMLVSAFCVVPAHADDYDTIIEKNLFHDQRQKWEMEKTQGKGAASQAGPGGRQEFDQIKLFGTVVKDSLSYAVMRVTDPPEKSRASRRDRAAKVKTKDASGNKLPYAVGDFIGGYQIVKILSGSVVLQDPYDNTRYDIFMNDGQTERIAERTEIEEDAPEPGQSPSNSKQDRKSRSKLQAQARASSKKGTSTDAIRKRFEKDLQVMRDDKNAAVVQQAERDWKKLEPLMPSLDEQGQEELMRLKSEFENLRQ